MNLKELKYQIGERAEMIIASGLGLQKNGGKYVGQCPRGGHKKDNPSYQWKQNHFYCHDCGTVYDIIDFFRETQGKDWYRELCKEAGVKLKAPELKTVKPVTKSNSTAGIEYLKSRGISEEILDLYKVRSDDSWIYFNYATPDKKLVATKWRSISEKKFNATKGGSSILYGLHLLDRQKTLVICEGEIDALTMATVFKGMMQDFLFSSLPNGASSLESAVKNCKIWLDMFESIIIIPDSDDAGKDFRKQASELLADYKLYCVNLPCKDVNEYLTNPSFNPNDILHDIEEIMPELLAVDSAEIEVKTELFHFKSGFPTIDFNWNGLQGGWLSLLSGKRNSGKTLMAKQVLIAAAMQGIKSYYFTGEEKIAKEKMKLAMIGYGDKGASVMRSDTINGAKRFIASQEAIQKYNTHFAPLIRIIDFTMTGTNIFEQILPDMERAIRHGIKLFVLDNLMILTNGTNDATRKERERQIYIIRELKKFTNLHDVHVFLIVHPNKGGEDISGAAEIQNLADGIMVLNRYNNIEDPDLQEKFLNLIRRRYGDFEVTSLLRFSKGRDDATFYEMGLVFDPESGRLLDASPEMDRAGYYRDGFFAVPRIPSDAMPDYDKQYSGE